MQARLLFLLFSIWTGTAIQARPLVLPDNKLDAAPPRIIRTCCAFGVNMKMTGLPFVRYNDITGLERIGPHTYLGSKEEGNGILYTRNGGFVDIGHVRDQADWTAFLYSLFKKYQAQGSTGFTHKLGYEGGPKLLQISLPNSLRDEDLMILAGRIAYDLSVWHEIGTWNGTSLIPMLPERYSAFSIEDGYSNMLGILLGIQALKSNLPFEEAMTRLLNESLVNLGALPTLEETRQAMLSVEGEWWSNRIRLPSGKVVKKRQFGIYPCIEPVLLPQFQAGQNGPMVLSLPELPSHADPNQYYSIYIQLNNKFPVKEIFGDMNRIITQRDFPALIDYAARESETKYGDLVYKEPRKNRRYGMSLIHDPGVSLTDRPRIRESLSPEDLKGRHARGGKR